METPKIYVGTYSKYNNGSICGEWVELDRFADKDEFYNYCKNFHNDEEDPEFMFQDWEGIPERFISESSIAADFWEWMDFDLSDEEREDFEAFEEHMSGASDLSESLDNFRSAYQGRWKSQEDYAENLLEETGELESIPENLRYYFDYEKYARDLFVSDFYYVDETGAVFSNHY